MTVEESTYFEVVAVSDPTVFGPAANQIGTTVIGEQYVYWEVAAPAAPDTYWLRMALTIPATDVYAWLSLEAEHAFHKRSFFQWKRCRLFTDFGLSTEQAHEFALRPLTLRDRYTDIQVSRHATPRMTRTIGGLTMRELHEQSTEDLRVEIDVWIEPISSVAPTSVTSGRFHAGSLGGIWPTPNPTIEWFGNGWRPEVEVQPGAAGTATLLKIRLA